MHHCTMFIVTDDNQSARLALTNGEILSIAMPTARGSVAIEHLKPF